MLVFIFRVRYGAAALGLATTAGRSGLVRGLGEGVGVFVGEGETVGTAEVLYAPARSATVVAFGLFVAPKSIEAISGSASAQTTATVAAPKIVAHTRLPGSSPLRDRAGWRANVAAKPPAARIESCRRRGNMGGTSSPAWVVVVPDEGSHPDDDAKARSFWS